jgi:putative lipoprotein
MRLYIILSVIPLVLLLIAAAKSPVKFEKYRGHYVFGHEVRTFQPCSSTRIYWVKAEKDIDGRLRETHGKLTEKPYEAIYIEVLGRLMDKAADGFAANYEGQLVIQHIELMQVRGETDCKER